MYKVYDKFGTLQLATPTILHGTFPNDTKPRNKICSRRKDLVSMAPATSTDQRNMVVSTGTNLATTSALMQQENRKRPAPIHVAPPAKQRRGLVQRTHSPKSQVKKLLNPVSCILYPRSGAFSHSESFQVITRLNFSPTCVVDVSLLSGFPSVVALRQADTTDAIAPNLQNC